MELKNRKDMDAAFQWRLEDIYPDKAGWENAFAHAAGRIDEIKDIKGTLGQSPEAMRSGLDRLYDILSELFKVGVYAFLAKAGDGSDSESQEMSSRADELDVRFSTELAFLEPEILAIPKEKLNSFMSDSRLAGYRHIVEDITRGRVHILDEEHESLIASLGEVFGGPSDTFDMLCDVDLTYPVIRDENGEEIRITNGNYGMLRESRSRAVREADFEGYLGRYREFINVIASNYASSVKIDNWKAKIYGYNSACERALDRYNVPLSVYDSLVEATHNSLPVMKKYLDLRRKAMKLEKLDCFDLYTPIVEGVDYPMPYEEGKKLVREALLPLGEDYQRLLDKAFSEGWIDVYENKGKNSGAFSCGVHGVHPYVLLNYTDTLDDAFTLAHELGHAMHSYKSSEAQDFANHDYSLLVAEVASTVNEVLLTLYLLRTETDTRRRAYVLNHFLESFRTTLFRQVLFAEFERKAHDMQQAGKPLTAKALCALYRELLELYYEGAEINGIMENEWAYISHFYRAFYVYQYATGFSSAVAIASGIVESGDPSAYLRFLTLGGSAYPLDELKVAGVDLARPETVLNAMQVFSSSVDELASLLD